MHYNVAPAADIDCIAWAKAAVYHNACVDDDRSHSHLPADFDFAFVLVLVVDDSYNYIDVADEGVAHTVVVHSNILHY